MKPYLIRGVLAGGAGGLASVVVLLLLGESSIREAIALEAAASTGEAHEEMFGRGTQVLGGALGLVLVGVLLGVIFGIVYAATRHRLGAGAPWRRAQRLGAMAFVAVPLVPFLKYPANPPAVGNPDTVDARTIAYVSMIAISVLAMILAVVVRDRLDRRGVREPAAQSLAVALWLAVVAAAFAVLPPNPDEIAVPADLLWSFRIASIGGQLAFWAVAPLVFGVLCERAVSRRAAARGDQATPADAVPGGGAGTTASAT